ncbi:hypothetical protein [Chryseobacterium sp. Leaf201]|jgi:hypothetical protein|uniref:hypothetical protein n=1 Tax=Chryseobacterium sp. Leaf201 TaxID=1735672 RepID=UPI0006F509B0|nr:hypothetical protein [Chryseobacterium sp. Leaf201]KQM52902.1 hypothetical protein ASE55_19630 [Chryseobacterium sp. Leaf201]
MIGIRLIIDKNKKEKILTQIKQILFFKELNNENIGNYKIKNTLVWEFEIEQNTLSNQILSIFSNHWNITLDESNNINSAMSENRIKIEGISWVNFELY